MVPSATRARLLLCMVMVWTGACGPAASSVEDPRSGGSPGGAGRGGAGGSGGGGSGGTGGAGGAAGNPGAAVPLPMTVTAHFQNQGWFADAAVSAHFQPGSMVISQADAIAGPCAARNPGARGKCLKVTYTPPPNLIPPAMGGYVGVFFLTTLLADHPELMPPAMVGQANWGAEPGRNVAPGATRIAFLAAAAQEGLAVTFKAGTDKDLFVVPEQTETLGTAWKGYAISLSGKSYGSNVVGAFAWVLKDTSRAATFYLDGIVWE